MDPIEEMRQQVSKELQGSVTIVGKLVILKRNAFFLPTFSRSLFFSL